MNKFNIKNFSYLDDSTEDAFDVGDDNCVCNFYPLDGQFKFWGGVNPKNYILLLGAEGETVFKNFQNWRYSYSWFHQRGERENQMKHVFKDVLFPYLDYNVLKATMSFTDNEKNIFNKKHKRDQIRIDLMKKIRMLDLDIQQADHNIKISESRLKYMKYKYDVSLFKKKYNIPINMQDIKNNFRSFSSRMWGFAVTVYEKIFR